MELYGVVGKFVGGRALKKGAKQKEGVQAGENHCMTEWFLFLYGGDVCMKPGHRTGDVFFTWSVEMVCERQQPLWGENGKWIYAV